MKIRQAKRSTTKKKVRSFLGPANYYRDHILSFLAIAEPPDESIDETACRGVFLVLLILVLVLMYSDIKFILFLHFIVYLDPRDEPFGKTVCSGF